MLLFINPQCLSRLQPNHRQQRNDNCFSLFSLHSFLVVVLVSMYVHVYTEEHAWLRSPMPEGGEP